MLPKKSQSEKFVESIFSLSILMLLVVAIAAFYIASLIIPVSTTSALGTTVTLIFLFYQSSFSIMFFIVLALSYILGKTESKQRRTKLVKITRIVMLSFVLLALLTFSLVRLWDSYYSQPIQVAFFIFLTLVEVLILEINAMALSVPPSDN